MDADDGMAARRGLASGRAVLAWALAALATGGVFAASMTERIAPQSDLWDYAQEARQLARGEGFTSLYTYPVHLRPGEEPPFPVRWRMPLYAAIGAGMLRLGVPLPAGYLYLGAVTHALLVALTFLLAARLAALVGCGDRGPAAVSGPASAAGPAVAGHVAAACALVCPLLLDPYNPGMSQTLAAVLGLAVWLVVLRRGAGGTSPAGAGAPATGALAAVPAAAVWYLRGETAMFLPLWLWAARGWRQRAAFAVVYAAACGAWLIALRATSGAATPIHGNPMLLYTPEYPGYSSSRMFHTPLPGALAFVLAHFGSFAFRWAKDVAGYVVDFFGGMGPIAVALAVAGLAARTPEGARHEGRAWTRALPILAAIPLQIAILSTLERSPRFLVPVIPLACALAGVAAAAAFAVPGRARLLAVLLAVLLLERGGALAFQRADSYRRFPPLPRALAAEMAPRAAALPARTLILTDIPDWAAWHLDRPALLLPLFRDLGRVRASQHVGAILLSGAARARNLADADSAWIGVADRGDSIPGFQRPELLAGGVSWYDRVGEGPGRR